MDSKKRYCKEVLTTAEKVLSGDVEQEKVDSQVIFLYAKMNTEMPCFKFLNL